MGKSRCCKKLGLNKGKWSTEEDEKLINYIKIHGDRGSWTSLPQNAGLLRCGKSCRLRWVNYLRQDVKRGNFTQQEEEAIVRLHSSIGNRWSLIARHLPGRTDNEIKNYWTSHLSRTIYRFRSLGKSAMVPSADIAKTSIASAAENFKPDEKATSESEMNQLRRNNAMNLNTEFETIDSLQSPCTTTWPNALLVCPQRVLGQDVLGQSGEVVVELMNEDKQFETIDCSQPSCTRMCPTAFLVCPNEKGPGQEGFGPSGEVVVNSLNIETQFESADGSQPSCIATLPDAFSAYPKEVQLAHETFGVSAEVGLDLMIDENFEEGPARFQPIGQDNLSLDKDVMIEQSGRYDCPSPVSSYLYQDELYHWLEDQLGDHQAMNGLWDEKILAEEDGNSVMSLWGWES